MGKWNRRYLPRGKSRHYDYEDPPLSPPRSYDNHSNSSDNKMSSWEIEYCKSARVPWNKVLASKKYIYCYPNVLHWDASAGNEALQNAKKRFWATLNGLPCDIPLPDPDLYIDEIDWNPHMDPELMVELDLPVFDPDKAQEGESLEAECSQRQDEQNQYTSDNNPWERNSTLGSGSVKDPSDNPWERNKTPGAGSSKDISDNPWERNNAQGTGSLKDTSDNPWERSNTQGAESLNDTSDNPWERNNMQGASDNPWGGTNTQGGGSSKDLQGWSRWDDLVDLKNGDPWEQSCSNPVDSLKDNAWRSGNGNSWRSKNDSWDWNKGNDNSRPTSYFDYKRVNSWNFNGKSMAARQGRGQGQGQGWGRGGGWDRGRGREQRGNSYWGSSAMNTKAEGQMNLVNCGYSFENNYSTGPMERGWKDNRNESWGGKNAECRGDEPKYWDSQTSRRGGRSFHGSGRKRESSPQHTSKYKSFKYYGDTYGDNHQ